MEMSFLKEDYVVLKSKMVGRKNFVYLFNKYFSNYFVLITKEELLIVSY